MSRVVLVAAMIQTFIVLGGQPEAHAHSSAENPSEKHAEKKKAGWSLEEWLATKERNRLMDQWLMLHTSPNLYEFYLGYEPDTFLDLTGRTQGSPGLIEIAAYATLAGVSGTYLTDGSGWSGSFRLRVLGSSDQSTNLTLEYGLRSRTNENTRYDAMAAAALLTVNLTQNFGLIGNYRHIFETHNIEPQSPKAAAQIGAAQEWRMGLFLDFKFFRIYSQWFQKPQINAPAHEGAIGGLRLYF